MKNNYRLAILNIIKIIFGLFLLGLLYYNILWVFLNVHLFDYGSFLASGKASLMGLNPFASNYPMIFHILIPKINIDIKAVNLNPPIFLPLFEILSKIPPYLSFRLWQVFSIILYIIIMILLIKNYPKQTNIWRIAWLISLAGLWHSIVLGQIYILLLFICVSLWIFNKNGQKWGFGILLGLLISIKPNFGIWILFLLLIKEYYPAIIAGITFVGVSLIPVMIYGISIYFYWNDAIKQFSGYTLPANNSLVGLFTRFGSYRTGTIISIFLVIAVAFILWKKKPSIQITNGLAITVALLSSPIAWCGYTLFLIPILYERKWNQGWKIVSALLIMPFYIINIYFTSNQFNFIFWGWFYGWALVLLLILLLLEIKIEKKNLDY